MLNRRSTSVLNATVATKRGVVMVGGKAGNTAEKDLVTKLVADINGVKGVNPVVAYVRRRSHRFVASTETGGAFQRALRKLISHEAR